MWLSLSLSFRISKRVQNPTGIVKTTHCLCVSEKQRHSGSSDCHVCHGLAPVSLSLNRHCCSIICVIAVIVIGTGKFSPIKKKNKKTETILVVEIENEATLL